jgi:hypothetical protein
LNTITANSQWNTELANMRLTTNRADAPYTASMFIVERFSYQANDPVVHYTAEDLGVLPLTVKFPVNDRIEVSNTRLANAIDDSNLGKVNVETYKPWGLPANDPNVQYKISIKDPLIFSPDNWAFPTTNFPSVGWIGRVHRGTPWQTIYLKSEVEDPNQWATNWAGSYYTHPTNDWKLLDLFTAAPNENAMRGLLSVNQTNVASWSAVLSGTMVLTNDSSIGLVPTFVDPKTLTTYTMADGTVKTDTHVRMIVDAINNYRTNRAAGVYSGLADIASVPELTVKSPYLNTADDNQVKYIISDLAYEALPQQIAGLIKAGESRFVVYSYGQSLKPAEDSILLDPPLTMSWLKNMCTNYQITAEMATRTVLRVDGTPEQPKIVIESFNVLPEE